MAQLTLVLLLLEASVVCFLASASVLKDSKAATTTCGLRPVEVTGALKPQPASWLHDRIIGGRDAKYGEYPWQARLSHGCGGIIIDEYWILSAAHCYPFEGADHEIAHVGELNREIVDEHEQSFPVEKWIQHEKFNETTADYDIALLKLKPVRGKGIQFNDYVQPACLPEADTPYTDGKMCHLSGWGLTDFENPNVPIALQGVEIPFFNLEECRELYSGMEITPRMVCAGSVGGKVGPCGGDSGGPLVCKEKRGYTVMGITSFGKSCEVPKPPDVFARVAELLPWIAQTMKE